MKTESYLRYLLNDNHSLMRYFRNHKGVSLDDIKRSVLLKVRGLQYSVPDHYYRLGTEVSFSGINSISEIFTSGIPKLAEKYLEMWDGKVYVKGKEFNDWQLLLPDIPPLILVVSRIWKMVGGRTGPYVDYAWKHLAPSLRFTAFPSAYLPEMELTRQKADGFRDLHVHLNGSMETDLVWHDFLSYPIESYQVIKEAFYNQKVKEQVGQMTFIEKPYEFCELFLIAGRIRNWLFNRIVNGIDIYNAASFEDLLNRFAEDKERYLTHPFTHCLGSEGNVLLLEGMLYVAVLDYLSHHKDDDVVAMAFHYYLLITGVCNRLLVQQTDAFGFEQFQKYTMNNLRELSEQAYKRRFLQYAGNELRNLRHVDGRFSPKNTLDKNLNMLENILNGFDVLTEAQVREGIKPSSLSLTAHFIKKPEGESGSVRFSRLRHELGEKSDALVALKNTDGRCGKAFNAVDAAASEFDTPPEVFAPYFRRLRMCGIRHFTFHAGEDFFHILTGIRAIYEAMEFLDLRPGDRIGHGTASGVDVALWRRNIGERVWMRIEDYLDDLVFAYFLITEYKEKQLEGLLPLIALRVQELCAQIYPKNYSMYELISAWRLRWMDPEDDNRDYVNKDAYDIFQYRHTEEGRNRGNRIISVDAYDILGEEDLRRLQLLLLRAMHKKQVIIETLPTSNVIIGHHHDFTTYHLYNWYKWGREGHEIPPIVVGTDDTGIFATNIFNEYCHIYCMLVFDKGLTSYDALDFIQYLIRNSETFEFR